MFVFKNFVHNLEDLINKTQNGNTNIHGHSLQYLTDSLMLNASFIGNPGMLHGKMGISIFFYHLARQTGNQIYEDYAGELIDEIYEEITANMIYRFINPLKMIFN